ncbi:hypothetical protein B6N60_02046 [Richelia sinica FACHB-800]|uniref:Uncharacterized protein n=1 Tax=Richelia sinica FACHB-800 TaxID=1357546 RepID=A0A975Y4N0_9NOST|nr:hypothetical protein [Richelia sinica]MBD2665964.1 hypothetical protein [Richelia sinica FACHB-800]QXE23356.1 hypothetical protein B6N60_02046 [Richelia sinica FACHB-800]
MLKKAPNPSAELAENLLIHYSFDLSGYTASQLVDRWQREFPADWLHLGVIEALYQGRYKAVSVQQILNFWHRRGQVSYHFNLDFERMICSKFPERLTMLSAPLLPPAQPKPQLEPARNEQLPPVIEKKVFNSTPSQTEAEKPVLVGAGARTVNGGTSPVVKNVTPPPIPMARVAISPPITQTTPPTSAHNPPIGQFTPEMSDRSESFTSKLKAMTATLPEPVYATSGANGNGK